MTHESYESDAELLAETATDPEAFGRFYRRHVTPVLALLLRWTGRADLAADLTAETFATALLGAGAFRGDGSARGWLFGIADRKLRDSEAQGRVEATARRKLELPGWDVRGLDRTWEVIRARRICHSLGDLVTDLPEAHRDVVLALAVRASKRWPERHLQDAPEWTSTADRAPFSQLERDLVAAAELTQFADAKNPIRKLTKAHQRRVARARQTSSRGSSNG